MVCAKCSKLLTKSVAAPDPFRNRDAAGMLVSSASGSAKSSSMAGKSSGASSSSAAASVQRTASGPARKIGENKLLSGRSHRFNPLGNQCTVCKQRVTQDRAKYCQNCAYKRGCCSICGVKVLDTKMYKQSS